MKLAATIVVSDLSQFREEGEVVGAGKENVWRFIHGLVSHVCEKRMNYLAAHPNEEKENPVEFAAVMEAYRQEQLLAERISGALKIEG